MGTFEPTGPVKSFRDGGGEVTVWFPAEEMVAGRVVGDIGGSLATAAFDEVDRHAASHGHPGRGFIDLSAMTHFDWEARLILVRWNIAHRHQASRLDFLADSWLAHMALRALSIVLDERLVAHEDRVLFEATYMRALAERVSVRPPASP